MIRARAGVAAALVAAVAACGPSTRTPEPRGPPRPWTWTASTGGPWRLPEIGFDVAIAPDDGHAIVRISVRSAAVIDLATGVVIVANGLVPATGKLQSMVRVRDRLLAFGELDGAPAAWSLTATPPTATRLPLTDTTLPPVSLNAMANAAALSPDGSRILVCSIKLEPVVRDAASLAVIQVLDATGACKDPVFADNGHVQYRGFPLQAIDLATGAVTKLSATGPITFGGPGGRSLTVTDHIKWKLVDGAGVATQTNGRGAPRWLADGSAVVAVGLGELIVHPTTGAGPRTIALPVKDMPTGMTRMAITPGGVAVIVTDYIVIAVDLATGAVRTVDGNVGPPVAVAPRDGTVIATTDRIRAWRDGALLANGDPGVLGFAVDPPAAPVLTITASMVSEWEPATGDRRVVHELAETGSRIARAGDRVVFDDGATLMRRKRGELPSAWFRFRDDLILAGLDAAAGRVAWYAGDTFFVADINHGPVFAFCANAMVIDFAPGSDLAGAFDRGTAQVYDLATKTAVRRLELEDASLYAAAFVGGKGDLVLATDHELILWDEAGQTAVGWDTGDAGIVAALGVDAAGTEVAIGYADGSLRWATIAGVRAHAHTRPIEVTRPDAGTCTLPRDPVLDDLTVGADDDAVRDDADPDEVECDDSNDNPDDDCSVIYGTPPP